VARPRASAWLARGAAFAAGVALVAGALALARPGGAASALARLRFGAEPSAGGVVATLSAAPPGTHPAQGGPWVALTFRNVGAAAAELWLPEVSGGELGFEVLDAAGRRVAGSPPGPHTDAVRMHAARLEPGEAVGIPCDLARWVDLASAAPGPLRVRAERVPVAGDPHRCRSNWVTLQR